MATLENIEYVAESQDRVVISVSSDVRPTGTYVACGNGGNITTLNGQPSINIYPKEEQEKMKQLAAICYVLTRGNDRNI